MSDQLDVLLEIGPKGKRVVASAMDWPGLERWGRTEGEAIDKLLAYVPRYAPVAERVGLGAEFERDVVPHILERTPGNTSTDWWGIAHVPSVIEAEPLPNDEIERRIGLMQGAWACFDDASHAVASPLTKGPRGGRARAGPDRPSCLRVGTPQLLAQGRDPRGRRGPADAGGARRVSRALRGRHPRVPRRGPAGAQLAAALPHPPHGAARNGPRLGAGGPRPRVTGVGGARANVRLATSASTTEI